MTPFEKAYQDWADGKIMVPSVYMGDKEVAYFLYQIHVHRYHLKLMCLGLKTGVRVKDIKDYYGLKGRTAKDVYKSFNELIKSYNLNTQP